MLVVATRHAKLFPRQLPVATGVQDGLDVAAEVWPDADMVLAQEVSQCLGDRPAKQQVEMQFRQRTRQRFRRLGRQDDLPPRRFPPVATG